MVDDVANKLVNDHLIISCEGSAEEVIVEKLIAGHVLVFPDDHIVAVTRKRKAADIQGEYLNYDFEWPVSIVRIHDSRNEAFKLGSLYRGRFSVINVITRPEIDVLAILREGRWEQWKKTGKRPSEYCKGDLRMPEIKRADFLRGYWDVNSIAHAAREYRRVSRTRKDGLCLADIIKG